MRKGKRIFRAKRNTLFEPVPTNSFNSFRSASRLFLSLITVWCCIRTQSRLVSENTIQWKYERKVWSEKQRKVWSEKQSNTQTCSSLSFYLEEGSQLHRSHHHLPPRTSFQRLVVYPSSRLTGSSVERGPSLDVEPLGKQRNASNHYNIHK